MNTQERAAARVAALAAAQAAGSNRRQATPQDYVYDKSQEAFWDLEDCTLHSAEAVDASIPVALWRVEAAQTPAEPDPAAPRKPGRPPGSKKERLIKPSNDIMRVENDQFVEGAAWWPGQPQIIRDWLINAEGFRPAEGRRFYNAYTPPPAHSAGQAEAAGPWVEHIKTLWPTAAEHEYFFDYCAHMVQHPEVKCNTAIVLSGTQGIGKDAALLPVRQAVGAWNCKSVDPDEVFSPYKPWLQTLMLVVNEVRPNKDEFHASSMYNILKPLIAAPPDTLPMNEKYVKLRYVINVMRVFITTNDYMAMYVPDADRRLFIMHSQALSGWHLKAGQPDYFKALFGWLEAGGAAHVAAWLRARDLSAFDPKRPALKTVGWAQVASTWAEPEDGVYFALEMLGRPEVLFGSELAAPQFDDREEVVATLKLPRKIAHRMSLAGYSAVPHPSGAERFKYADCGVEFRSRNAFVRRDAGLTDEQAAWAIEQRGRALLAAKVAAGQPVMRGRLD